MAIQLVSEQNALAPLEANALLQRYMPADGDLSVLSVQEQAVISKLRALERGTAYIDLDRTIEAGGYDSHQRPRLGICHPQCACHCDVNISPLLSKGHVALYCCGPLWNKSFQTDEEREVTDFHHRQHLWRAKTPMIPARYRPNDASSNNRSYLLLFDALWEEVTRTRIPRNFPADPDPILLRHDGHGWVVQAVWDLTEVEARALVQGVLNR